MSKLSAPPNLPIFSGQEPVPSTEGTIDQWLFQVEGALATHTEEAVRSAVIWSVGGAAHELLEFIGYGEEMSDILRHIKERFGQRPSKAKLQKEVFLMEQRKTESINQFARQVEQRFKRLRALYPGRYDHGQLKERVFQGMHPHLRDSMRFLYMKEVVGYEEFLAACYVRQCSLVLKIVLYFFKCLGFWMHFISLYDALSLHNCSSSGSLVFAHLGRIN